MCVSAPLRVLITVAQWSGEQYQAQSVGPRLRKKWEGIVHARSETQAHLGLSVAGVLGVLIGECGRGARTLSHGGGMIIARTRSSWHRPKETTFDSRDGIASTRSAGRKIQPQ